MIQYRAFLNSDAPGIAQVWCGQASLRAVAKGVTPAVLEEQVFAKLYFDRHGLIVAEEEGKLVGFVHAGFLPGDKKAALSTERGVVSLLMVLPRADATAIGCELLRSAEEYLLARGASSIIAGSPDPVGPFYLGLYGGSLLPGVLEGDQCWLEVLAAGHYVESRQRLIFQRELSGFRPPIDRQMMQIRRQCQWTDEQDPSARSWWEACTTADLSRTRFSLSSKTGPGPTAEVTFWSVEPLASQWGVHAMGMLSMKSADAAEQQGWETYLLAESLRQFQQDGVTLVEVQLDSSDLAGQQLVEKLGFDNIDRAIVFEKTT